jgi:hypothetical protein
MQWAYGPQYCETPLGISAVSFPVEPFNTWSNLTIILFALVGFAIVSRRAPKSIDLYILCALLLATGIGSFFFHGLREWWALRLDVWAGVLFLMSLFFLWGRRVMPLWQAVILFVAFFLVTRYFDEINLIPYGRWASMMPAVLLFGGYLIYRSAAFSTRSVYLGCVAIGSTLLALTFRTLDRLAVDQAACDIFPIGTHFLWHGFLSAGAFLGMLAMIEIIRSQANQAPSKIPSPVAAPAE